MSELSKAILCLFDQSRKSYHSQASHYIDTYLRTKKVYFICLKKLYDLDGHDSIYFWCFQMLIKCFKNKGYMNGVSVKEKIQIQQGLFGWINKIKNVNVQGYVMKEYCWCVVNLFMIEYLNNWGYFFRDFFFVYQNNLNDNKIIYMLLVMLQMIDGEIKQEKFIKDKIRKENVVHLISFWINILESSNNSNIILCLKVMTTYIVWIDIDLLITNKKFLSLFGKLMKSNFQNSCIYLLNAFVSKGMGGEKKLKVIQYLNVINIISSTNISVPISIITNTVCIELLELYENTRNATCYNTLQKLFVTVLKLFNTKGNLEVSISIYQFVESYVKFLQKYSRKFTSENVNEKNNMNFILHVIVNLLTYPDNFQFDGNLQSEIEIKYVEYRRSLFKIYGIIVKIVGYQNIVGVLKPILEKGLFSDNVKFSHLEIGLSLLYTAIENLRIQRKDQFFTNVILTIVKKKLFSFPHKIIQKLYYNIVAKYSEFVMDNQKVLGEILRSFVINGFNNSDAHIKITCYGEFLKFIRRTKEFLFPFYDKFFELIMPHIKFNPFEKVDLSDSARTYEKVIDDRFKIYEALGQLLSVKGLSAIPMKRKTLLELIMGPIIGYLKQVKIPRQVTPAMKCMSIVMAKQIHALGDISHGLCHKNSPKYKEVADVFQSILPLILNILDSNFNNRFIQQSVVYLLKTVITLYPVQSGIVDLFSPIILRIFALANANTQLYDVLSLVIQIVSIDKSNTNSGYLFVDKILTPLTQKFLRIIENGKYISFGVDQNESYRDFYVLHRIYFEFIHAIFKRNYTKAFLSNSNTFHSLLQIICISANSAYLRLPRDSFVLIDKFLPFILNNNNGMFDKYVIQNIIPVCFSAPLSDTFHLDDYQEVVTMEIIISIMKKILLNQKKYVEYVSAFLQKELNLNGKEKDMFLNTMLYNNQKRVCLDMYVQLIKSRKKIKKNSYKIC